MNFQIFNNIIVRILTITIYVLFIISGNVIHAQSGIVESAKSSDNKKSSITGIVVTPSGYSIAMADVHLYDPLTRKILLSSRSNRDGIFSFSEITPGNYLINISTGPYIDHPIAVSAKEGINDIGKQYLTGSKNVYYIPPPGRKSDEEQKLLTVEPSPLIKYPMVSGYRVLTVCETLKHEPKWIIGLKAIIIGNLIQTPEGNWLTQSCGNPIKSGEHIWPDTIFLNENIPTSAIYDKFMEGNDSILKEVIELVGKNIIQNNNSENNSVVVAIGTLVTGDNLVYVKCGEEKTCGSGYGSIAAPAQLNYYHMRYLNQQNANTD